MKRLRFFSVLVALFWGLSLSVEAQSVVASGICGVGGGSNLTWELTDNGILTVSGSGAMGNYGQEPYYPYNYTPAPWDSYSSQITSVVIGNSVTTIGNEAFGGWWMYNNLVSVAIGSSVISIGDRAFYYTGLTSIYIGNSVISIGENAFGDCSNLSLVNIGSGLISIGNAAFGGCSSLNTINVDGGNSNYCSDNGVLFNKSKSNLVCCPAGKYGNYTVPSTVTTISDYAFSDCRLTTVTMGNNVETIGNSAFYYSQNLTTVNIGNGVLTIGDWAFYNCYYLSNVNMGNSVLTIGERAFSSCSNLTSITIPNSVISLGNEAFSYCNSLNSITIPNGLKTIGDEVFISCKKITSIAIPSSVTSIGSSVFVWCEKLTDINVDNGNANYCSDNGVLFDKSKTTVICYPAGKTDTIYTIPNSVKTISQSAFHNGYFTYVNIPNSVKIFNNYAFCYCKNLLTVSIPDSITTIPYSAFSSCSNLKSVIIPDNIKTIEYYAFDDCSGLTSVTIGKNVTSIGILAFENCTSLKSLTARMVVPPALNTYYFPFRNVPDTIPVYIPCGTTATYQGTAGWNYFSKFIEVADTTFIYDAVCFGKSYNGNGFNISEGAGVYCRKEQSVQNCDSIICLTLTEHPQIPITTYWDTLCFGESYDFGGKTHTVSGTYYDTLYNINGCDSIIALVLDFYPNVPVFNYLKSIVEGETYNDANFKGLTQAGTYCDTLENVNDCDSIVCLTLTVNANGIKQLTMDNGQLTIYPNPVNYELRITNYELREGDVIEIYSVVGQRLNNYQLSTVNSQLIIDVSHLANGIYFLKIGNQVAKFIKE